MARNKKHLEGLLKLISQISAEEGNEWFVQHLADFISPRETLSIKNDVFLNNDVSQNVLDIKRYLLLDNIQLIDYSKIDDKKTSIQLTMDCIQMGRFRLGKINNEPNFDEFCRYAHLQAEELINYYFKKKFQSIENTLLFIKEYNPNYKSEKIPQNISSINYTAKVFTLINYFNQLEGTFNLLLFLNEVRNNISHRSTYELAIKDEEQLFHNFIKRFKGKYLNKSEKQSLNSDEKYLYEKGLYLKKRKEEPWDSIYEKLQYLLIAILEDLNNSL